MQPDPALPARHCAPAEKPECAAEFLRPCTPVIAHRTATRVAPGFAGNCRTLHTPAATHCADADRTPPGADAPTAASRPRWRATHSPADRTAAARCHRARPVFASASQIATWQRAQTARALR